MYWECIAYLVRIAVKKREYTCVDWLVQCLVSDYEKNTRLSWIGNPDVFKIIPINLNSYYEDSMGPRAAPQRSLLWLKIIDTRYCTS